MPWTTWYNPETGSQELGSWYDDPVAPAAPAASPAPAPVAPAPAAPTSGGIVNPAPVPQQTSTAYTGTQAFPGASYTSQPLNYQSNSDGSATANFIMGGSHTVTDPNALSLLQSTYGNANPNQAEPIQHSDAEMQDWINGINGAGRSAASEMVAISQVFAETLGRLPSWQDQEYYADLIAKGIPWEQIAANVRSSPEAQAFAASGAENPYAGVNLLAGGQMTADGQWIANGGTGATNTTGSAYVNTTPQFSGGIVTGGSGGSSGASGATGGANTGTSGAMTGGGSSSNTTSGITTSPAATASSYPTAQLGAPTPWNVTADQTVEGRINAIINGGSPLMKQAETGALEQMNQRGLANSSLAISAGQDAMYKAAMPIAQADAATFAKSAGYNADMGNQFAVHNVDWTNQLTQARMQNDTQRELALLNSDTQKQIASWGNSTQLQVAGMNISAQRALTDLQNSNQTLLTTNGQAANAFNQAVSAISVIQNNNQMDANTKTQAIANIWHDLQTQLTVLGATSGLNLSAQLNFANMPGFDAQGKWVGFPATTVPAPAPGAAPAPATSGAGASTGAN